MSAILEYPQRHRVDVQEYLRMGEAAVFGADARLELIEGEIIEMAPVGSRHAGAVKLLNRAFSRHAGSRAIVSVQDPLIAGPHSVPQPDLALLKPRADSYSTSHPTTEDVLLVVCAVTRRRFPVGASPTRRTAPAGSNRSNCGGNEMVEAFG